MVKKVIKILIVIICTFCLMFTLSGCEINNDKEKTLGDKANEEIRYVENKILTFFSRYAKGEYGNIDDLDWNAIDENILELNNVLDTVILDLTDLDVGNDDIIAFRNGLNSLSIAASNKDITVVTQKCGELYSLLPTYKKKYSDNKNEINIIELKSLVVSSFVYANSLDWGNAKNTIASAETKYKEMMDDVDYMKEYSYNLNKVYILVGELKNAIDLEEIELTKIKYINFIEKI